MILDKFSKPAVMSPDDVADEVRALVRGLGRPGEDWQVAFARLSRASGISERRIKAFAHGEARRVEAYERDRLRALVIQELQEKVRRTQHELALKRAQWGIPDDLDADRSSLRTDGGATRAAA